MFTKIPSFSNFFLLLKMIFLSLHISATNGICTLLLILNFIDLSTFWSYRSTLMQNKWENKKDKKEMKSKRKSSKILKSSASFCLCVFRYCAFVLWQIEEANQLSICHNSKKYSARTWKTSCSLKKANSPYSKRLNKLDDKVVMLFELLLRTWSIILISITNIYLNKAEEQAEIFYFHLLFHCNVKKLKHSKKSCTFQDMRQRRYLKGFL